MSNGLVEGRTVKFGDQLHEWPDGKWRYFPPPVAAATTVGTAGGCPYGDCKGACSFDCVQRQVADADTTQRRLWALAARAEITDRRLHSRAVELDAFSPHMEFVRVPLVGGDICPPPGPAAARPRPWQKMPQKSDPAPGSSNTRAQKPVACYKGKITACVDWLEGYMRDLDLRATLELLSITSEGRSLEWVETKHKRSGREMFVRGNVEVFNFDAGVYVRISGQGCRQLEGDKIVSDWQALARKLVNSRMEVKRFDCAWDDKAQVLPFVEVEDRIHSAGRDWEGRSFTTRATKAGGEWSGGRDIPYGETLTVGKRGSDTFLRIYDKAAQTQAKKKQGLPVSDEEESATSWTRAELEWRRERACAALTLLAEGGLGALAGVLRSHVDFKDMEHEPATRLTRGKTVAWWAEFCDYAEKAQLTILPVTRSVEKGADWIQKQVAPTLALLAAAPGYGLEAIVSLALAGASRLRKSHEIMLGRHKENIKNGTARAYEVLTEEETARAAKMIDLVTGEFRMTRYDIRPQLEKAASSAELVFA